MDMGIEMLEISKKIKSGKVSVASGGISELQKKTTNTTEIAARICQPPLSSEHGLAKSLVSTVIPSCPAFFTPNSYSKSVTTWPTWWRQQEKGKKNRESMGVLCTMRMWSVVTVLQGLDPGGASFSASVSDWHGCKVVNIKWPYFDSAMPDLCFCQTCLTHSRDKQVHARATW